MLEGTECRNRNSTATLCFLQWVKKTRLLEADKSVILGLRNGRPCWFLKCKGRPHSFRHICVDHHFCFDNICSTIFISTLFIANIFEAQIAQSKATCLFNQKYYQKLKIWSLNTVSTENFVFKSYFIVFLSITAVLAKQDAVPNTRQLKVSFCWQYVSVKMLYLLK